MSTAEPGYSVAAMSGFPSLLKSATTTEKWPTPPRGTRRGSTNCGAARVVETRAESTKARGMSVNRMNCSFGRTFGRPCRGENYKPNRDGDQEPSPRRCHRRTTVNIPLHIVFALSLTLAHTGGPEPALSVVE